MRDQLARQDTSGMTLGARCWQEKNELNGSMESLVDEFVPPRESKYELWPEVVPPSD